MEFQVFWRASKDPCSICEKNEDFHFNEVPDQHYGCRCTIEWQDSDFPEPEAKLDPSKAEIDITEKTSERELATFVKTSECNIYPIDEEIEIIEDLPSEIENYKPDNVLFNGLVDSSYNNHYFLTNVRDGDIVKLSLLIKYRILKIAVPYVKKFKMPDKEIEYKERWVEGTIKIPIEVKPKVERFRKK